MKILNIFEFKITFLTHLSKKTLLKMKNKTEKRKKYNSCWDSNQ